MSASLVQISSPANPAVLGAQFAEIRNRSLRLTARLSAEDQMLQSMPDASPTKWHLAHTTWFFETFILEPNVPGYHSYDSRFKYLLNSYYKQLGAHPNRSSRGLMSRPSLEEVHQYRAYVDAAVLASIDELDPSALALLEIGLNHEQQHQELIMTDIKHALWFAPLRPDVAAGDCKGQSVSALRWIEREGGIYSIGHAGSEFAFDNEGPRHDVLLQGFQIASRAVTNSEYLAFMSDNGYRRPELWLSDGWDQVCAHHWNSPFYWDQHEDKTWWQFAHDGMKPVNPAEPVCHVSYFEAEAYARWAGFRLPTEAEWEVTAVQSGARGTLLEDELFHPQAAAGEGFQQAFGDVWEWTASPYTGYPGFQPASGAVGEYNGKFMCNQLVLRGGSCVTPASHIRATYRNFFPPQVRWQFSGIRLAK
jgi:ergothioneine biosynthesis protein EgtB